MPSTLISSVPELPFSFTALSYRFNRLFRFSEESVENEVQKFAQQHDQADDDKDLIDRCGGKDGRLGDCLSATGCIIPPHGTGRFLRGRWH